MSELTSRTIAQLRDGFRAGEFTAREIAESFNAAVAAAKAPTPKLYCGLRKTVIPPTVAPRNCANGSRPTEASERWCLAASRGRMGPSRAVPRPVSRNP